MTRLRSGESGEPCGVPALRLLQAVVANIFLAPITGCDESAPGFEGLISKAFDDCGMVSVYFDGFGLDPSVLTLPDRFLDVVSDP